MSQPLASTTNSKSVLARRFFELAVSLLTAAALIAAIGVHFFGRASRRSLMPAAFWFSTILLGAGSVSLHLAAWHVRFQRLEMFRHRLVMALVFGTFFVGVQSCGLWRLVQNQTPVGQSVPDSPETGANAFVVMVAGLHGVHFLVAFMFVAWVTVNSFANRYDHEYSSSVTFCAWFWHTLGIVWMVILALFAAGAVTGFEAISIPDPQSSVEG